MASFPNFINSKTRRCRMKRSLSSTSSSEDNPENPETAAAPIVGSQILTLHAPVSPPRRRSTGQPSLAAIEAGKTQVTNHLDIFTSRLSKCIRPPDTLTSTNSQPRLSIEAWSHLYQRNTHPYGHHFVIHQHDHPIAGPHYDLRLQFSETSSLSWAIMYGLPGDANSRRLNRNATETRVHCLWNHLIETASVRTGSMIIWDTGEYEILPYQQGLVDQVETETENSPSDMSDGSVMTLTESEKLRDAFRNGKIRLRLHGTRLPRDYTIVLRMDRSFDAMTRRGDVPPKKRRRRRVPTKTRKMDAPLTSSESPSPSPSRPPSPPRRDEDDETKKDATDDADENMASDDEQNEEETNHQIRINNAYPGATNDIGSIHQRRWFISLDRANSGFCREAESGRGTTTTKKRWIRRQSPEGQSLLGFEPFYVRGPEYERSVVTGRLGRDVLVDEGVEGFIPRRGWRAVVY